MLDESGSAAAAAEYSSISASECLVEVESAISKRKKSSSSSSSKKKKRFSDDQIRSLELIFESDTKLEPMKKAQLAKQLGLHPRQVAIWFQNKRARWKSNQIHKDYTILLANHNNLASKFESLKKENQSLLIQLQKLKNERADQKKNHYKIQETAGGDMSSTDGELDQTKIDFNIIPWEGGMLSDDDMMSSTKAEEVIVQQLDEENDQLLKMVEPPPPPAAAAAGGADSSLTSSQDWGRSCLNSDDLIISQPSEGYPWWDFWC